MINRWISIRARCLSSRGSKISLNRTTSPRERILGSIIPEGWNSPSPRTWRRRRRKGGNPPVGGMVLMIFGGWLSRVTSERREAFLSLCLGQEPFYYTLLLLLLLLLSRNAPRVALSPPAKGCRGPGSEVVCFGTRERDTAKGKEKLVGRGWRVRGGPARKMAGKMEGSLSIMPGPSASLYASNNSLIDLRKTGHLRPEKTPLSLSPAFSALPTFLSSACFSFLFSPRVFSREGGKENPRASCEHIVRSRLRFPAWREWKIGERRVD